MLKLAVYGSLRNWERETDYVKGYMYSLGSFPALILDDAGSTIEVEIDEVSYESLKVLDRYEGYDEITNTGFYIRKPVKTVNGKEIMIYEFNNKSILTSQMLVSADSDGIVRWKGYSNPMFNNFNNNSTEQCEFCYTLTPIDDIYLLEYENGYEAYACRKCVDKMQIPLED